MATLLATACGRRGIVIARWWLAALLALPYFALGIYYYPSDPERWLFLMPLFWLVVALAWSEYRPGLISQAIAFRLLSLVIFAMAVTNVVFVLGPESRTNREFAGYRVLQQHGKEGDLVIGSGGKSRLVSEFVLSGAAQPYEMLGVSDVMLRLHKKDVPAGQQYLRQRIDAALKENRRVLAYGLIEEKLQKGQGYPWSFVANDGYEPKSILDVLDEYDPAPLVAPTPEAEGLYVLHGKK